ncbi:MAG: 4'-phosphopantetheinyl transferase superfamily protein [Paludibacteraceae bacterium]|nr:4'-phosphopantetheinyl transferase superfamily protein [Paludibacteraceae bacterium]
MEIIAESSDKRLQWQLALFDESAEELATLLGDAAAADRHWVSSRRIEAYGERLLLWRMFQTTVELLHRDNGAPYLSGRSEHISISHSKRFVAVASHPAQPVGIDVEVNTDRAARLSQRFMNDGELASAPADWRLREKALAVWCAKEAAYKCLPVEGCDFRSDMWADFDGRKISVRYQKRRFDFDCRLTPDYCLVVGTERPNSG